MEVKIIYFLFFVSNSLFQNVSCIQQVKRPYRTFEVDYTNDQFLKDGKPFRYISGSMHYFRVPRAYWRDRLRKIKACGLNAVSTYVEWSLHEPVPGKFNFEGENNLEHFISLAAEENLLVILRVGPYICAERDLGGLPWWLFQKKPNIRLRTNDTVYTHYVQSWLSELMPRMQPFLYGNGGPIIMVQVENEYNSYGRCNVGHASWLRDVFMSYVQNNAVLFTTDGGGYNNNKCGKIPNVLATIDFGPEGNLKEIIPIWRQYQKKGPLVNSEYYVGMLTHWGNEMRNKSTIKIVNKLKEMLDANASVNFYMFVGGTNFGFTSGANTNKGKHQPSITSYHNIGPINEAGDPTVQYYAIAQLLAEYFPKPPSPLPKPSPKGKYGILKLVPQVSLFTLAATGSKTARQPLTFEKFNQGGGFILYQTHLQGFSPDTLHIPKLHDRANVFVEESAVGVLSRQSDFSPTDQTDLQLRAQTGQKLSILVESQGHINYVNYTPLKDLKGILSEVTVNKVPQYKWSHFGFPPENLTQLLEEYESRIPEHISPPAIYFGHLKLKGKENEILDTFIDMRGWGKGLVFINGKNLGRYWCVGPQYSLYVPGCYLKQDNKIYVFELQSVREDLTVRFSKYPVFGKPNKTSIT